MPPNHAQAPFAYILPTRRHQKLFSLYTYVRTPRSGLAQAQAQPQISPPALRHNGAKRIGAFNDFRHRRRHSTCKFAFASNYVRRGTEDAAGATANACGKCNLEFQLYLYFYEGPPLPPTLPTRKHYKSSVLYANFL